MIETMTEKDVYLSQHAQLEKELGDGGPDWMRRMREAAIERFAGLGFPTLRHEDWKFTNVAPLVKVPFRLPPVDSPKAAEGFRLLSHGKIPGVTLVCMNGHRPFLARDSKPLPAGVVVCGLAEALRDHAGSIQAHLAQVADYDNHAFTALNTAFLREGAFVYVPPGVDVKEPIYLHVGVSGLGPAGYDVWYRRALVVIGKGSRATVVERFFGPPHATYFTSAVTEVVLGEKAVLDHYKLQQEGDEAFHVAALYAQQERASNFSTHFIGLGGKLVRNEVRVQFEGEGCESTINGLYMAGGRQHMDNHTVIDHAKPHCASHELYKGILDGHAHGVFNGKIFVHQDAQKTDAKQTNQTLLLSEDAVINTKPQLEIYADDVKCTHGATVGQLDDEAIFYLRSRGIGLEQARGLLTYAFANDIVDRVKIEPLREQLERQLLAKQHLPHAPEAKEVL